jgi:hypothetical protein
MHLAVGVSSSFLLRRDLQAPYGRHEEAAMIEFAAISIVRV